MTTDNLPSTTPYTFTENQQYKIQEAIEILESKFKQSEAFTNPTAVKQFCQLHLASEKDEQFCCLFLNSQHHLIKFEKVFSGTIDGASVYPRVIVRKALELNAAAIIFCHNHPSGVTEPSQSDIKLTERLTEALKLIDVRVLDHIITGLNETSSMAESGLL